MFFVDWRNFIHKILLFYINFILSIIWIIYCRQHFHGVKFHPKFRDLFNDSFLFFKKDNGKPSYEKKRLKNKFEVKIITETLADIFAKQGNYFDAMEAYTYLLKIKPERTEVLESKISEVEIQINKLINDF